MSIPYIIGRESVTVMVDGSTHTVDKTASNYDSLVEALRNKEWDLILSLVTVKGAVEVLSHGDISIKENVVYFKNNVLHNALTARIVDMLKDGFDVDPLVKFLENLMKNPSNTAVNELYDWLERTKLPITEDGCFLAYKKVRSDYISFYDNKTSNKVGEQLPEMPRNMVDDNRNNTCSTGYHFCSLSYLSQYYGGQGKVVILKVNPKDVVSIPNDYNFAKGRATTYLVIGEHTSEQTEAFDRSVVDANGVAIDRSPVRPNSFVMGVDFGTSERATLVQELLDTVYNNAFDGNPVSAEQARVIGFDDAWNDAPINLLQYRGNNLREALDFAIAYFEGYDRCKGASPMAGFAGSCTGCDCDNTCCGDCGDCDCDCCNSYCSSEEDGEKDEDGYTSEQRKEVERVLSLPLQRRKFRSGYNCGYEIGQMDGEEGGNIDLSNAAEGDEEYRNGYIGGFMSFYI